MYLPQVPESQQTLQVTAEFRGYNHNLRIAEGEFYNCDNITTDYFPLMANRRARILYCTALRGPITDIHADENGVLFTCEYKVTSNMIANGVFIGRDDLYTPVHTVSTESAMNHQTVEFGAYIIHFPGGYYYNRTNPDDHGTIENHIVCGEYTYLSLCEEDGRAHKDPITVETTVNGETVLYKYVDGNNIPIKPYVKIHCPDDVENGNDIGKQFFVGDIVDISNITKSYISENTWDPIYGELNGKHRIVNTGEGFIVIEGIICDINAVKFDPGIWIDRKSPKFDYVTVAQNRIWGCRFENDGKETVNQIFASALGRFTQYETFDGIATDSYQANVGSHGPFTGAITFNESPIFFKEDMAHRVYVSPVGAHQIKTLECHGVPDGNYRSIQSVGGSIIYYDGSGITSYDGMLNQSLSDKLGDTHYEKVTAGSFDTKYYACMRYAKTGGEPGYRLFVFNTKTGFWTKEEVDAQLIFASNQKQLFLAEGNRIWLEDVADKETPIDGEEHEDPVKWSAESGLIGYADVNQKYVSRFNLRMMLPKGSRADLWIEYDSSGKWEHCGHMEGRGTNSFMFPVRPRRCDHFRFKLDGVGDIRVYSMSKIYEGGSDVL